MHEAVRNYLLRWGLSFKDKEIVNLEESIKYFNLEGVGKSHSKLDLNRILSMNEYYIKNMKEDNLFDQLKEFCKNYKEKILPEKEDQVKKSLIFLKNKAKTLEDIFNNSKYLLSEKVNFNDEDLKLVDGTSKGIIAEFKSKIKDISKFDRESLEPLVNELIKTNNTNFKGVGQPLRIALTGSKYGTGSYDISDALGKDEVRKRLDNQIFIEDFCNYHVRCMRRALFI